MAHWLKWLAMACCGLAVAAASACGGKAPEDWTPVMEEVSTDFLRGPTERAVAGLREARATLATDVETASAALDGAERELERLLDYHLPLLEARASAYNAYRHYHLGEAEETARYLEEVESILLAVAESGHGVVPGEMKMSLEGVEDVRVALSGQDGEAAEALEALCSRLNFLLLRSDLVLTE